MSAAPRCAGCQQPIYGTIVDALSASWHPRHFVCVHCQLPIGEGQFSTDSGRPLHDRCAAEMLICTVCHSPLPERFLVDYWGNRYCPAHEGRYPHCPYCYRLMAGGGATAGGDSVRRCAVCLSSAVLNDAEAARLFAAARTWLHQEGVLVREGSVGFELIGRRDLERLLGGSVGRHFGITRGHRVGGRLARITVSMVRGLPRALFAGACVHELGHVWLRQHGIDRLASSDEEGYCELLAWRYFGACGTPEGRYHQQRIEEVPDPVYGGGFRQVRRLCERVGFGQLVNLLAYHKQMPR